MFSSKDFRRKCEETLSQLGMCSHLQNLLKKTVFLVLIAMSTDFTFSQVS